MPNTENTSKTIPSGAAPELSHLLVFAEVLNQQNEFSEILRVTTQQAAVLLHADLAMLFMINPRTRHSVKTLYHSGDLAAAPRYHTMHQQLAGWVMTNRRPLLSADLADDERFAGSRGSDVVLHAVLCVPLKIEGLIIGSLLLAQQNKARGFTENDLLYLEKLAFVAAPYLRNAQKIAEYFETPLPAAALLAKYRHVGLIGKSAKFVELLKTIEAAARCEVRVLLEGQTGTGKELVARAIHRFSARQAQPFIAMDCGAIPENLIESELFGHVKGAFTGAQQERKGLFEEAQRGTLFMDEVANLPLILQTKFMRVLEQNEIRPLGGNAARKIDVRLIAASSRSLRELVEQQLFREDLYYRLHVYPIAIPALHERRDDIPLLAEHFLQAAAQQQGKHAEVFHEALTEFMCERNWPGNVRELENFVERLVTLAAPASKILTPEILPQDLKTEFMRFHTAGQHAPTAHSLAENVAAYEAKLIREALASANWNQSQAARQLRMPVQTLQYRMHKLGIVKGG
ncbi:sigma-54-dependent Fis family transcriptional regulator [candidate division KSB1 bacterium]|nr:sigma-54-dependent Fis family transcriptional regulator [bacterium]NUM64934.1 sigma-54-dependent Fis family transcriptional regulator [candidate division KSB1 bacterium]